MSPFEKYFDAIFVVNLKRREDRLCHFIREMGVAGIAQYERFEAIDAGPNDGNTGCCASHKAVLNLIIQRGLRNGFIFEDDATVRDPFRNNFQETFSKIIKEVPDAWEMLYVGGGYAEKPRARISSHVILIGEMKTTSSYAVTAQSARELEALIPPSCPIGIDAVYGEYNRTRRCYITDPRLFIQYENYSDLQKAVLNNGQSMESELHVQMLDGKIR